MMMIRPEETISPETRVDRSGEYWKNLALTDVDRVAVPHDFFSGGKYEKQLLTYSIDGALFEQLNALARQQDLPLFVVFLTALYIELYKYSNQEAYVIGIPPYAGSAKEDLPLHNAILPVKSGIHRDMTVRQLLQAVQEHVLVTYENQFCDVQQIMSNAGIRQDLMELPAASIAFNTLHNPVDVDAICASSGNQVTVCLDKQQQSLELKLVYNAKLYHKETIRLFLARYINIITDTVSDLELCIGTIDMISEEEKQQILYAFNDTSADYPNHTTVQQLFEDQVAQTPDRVAVVCGNESLTYRTLNGKANQLARLLQTNGVKNDQVVAIMTHGSLELIIGILAVLKAGGAYVPIDVSYPKERKEYMLRHSGASLVLSTLEQMGELSFEGSFLDLNDHQLFTGDSSNVPLSASPRNLAYVIYTSGSTGNPKGVMIEHRSLINYISYCQKTYNGDYPLFSSISFDLTVTSIYVPLLSGHQVKVYDTNNKLAFISIVEEQVDVMKLTPAHLSVISGLPVKEPALSKFIVGGEELSYPLTDRIYRKFNGKVDIFNEYGPTEATVGCIVYKYKPKEQWEKTLPIGVPIHNTRIYILNEQRQIAPIGVVGDLWIAGDGLARGYWNNPGATAEKFVDDPFRPGEMMYRSGDIARWLPDGNIEFFGRVDNQVKIRGFRIELGEIEARLLGHPDVKEAVVLARENEQNEKYLSAYLVLRPGASISDIRAYLKSNLPDYMIPPYLTKLAQMPLTSNGKIDRKSLPEPDLNSQRADDYEAPRNEVEAKLADIWSEVLGAANIGITDNFFDLGGDSIKAIRVVSKLQKFGYKLEVKELFSHSSIKEVSDKVIKKLGGAGQEAVTGQSTLTPIQSMFFRQQLTDQHHWNQSVMLYSRARLQEDLLRTVFTQIVIHHDALRMVYRTEHNQITQFNRDTSGELFDFRVFDYRNEESPEEQILGQCQLLQSSISLEHGPLVKAGLFQTKEGDHLMIAIHHLVVDGVSWRILLEDLTLGYEQALSGEPVVFQEKTGSFQAWAAYLQQLADSDLLQEEQAYWDRIHEAACHPLPVDQPLSKAAGKVADQRQVSWELSPELTDDLVKRANRAYNTDIPTLLLTALGLAIQAWTGEEQILVNMEGHGRETPEGEFDSSRTVGWFTTHYPVLLTMAPSSSIAYAVKHVKETLKQIPHKGIGYGVLHYLGKPKNWNIKPQISFNYLGHYDAELQNDRFELSGLSPGPSVSLHAEPLYQLDMIGEISNQRLKMALNYDSLQYKDSTIEHLAESFIGTLEAIVQHCLHLDLPERTPSDYSAGDLDLEELDALKAKYEGSMNLRIRDIYPLTPMQEGMLFHSLIDKESGAYVEQRCFTIKGRLDAALFEESFGLLIQRYDILQALIVHEGLKSPKQIIVENMRINFRYEDLSAMPSQTRADVAAALEIADRKRGFQLSEEALLRASVFKMKEDEYRVVWSWHHMIMDGWCSGIVLHDFFTIYAGLKERRDIALKEPAPYAAYIQWLQNQPKSRAKRYWERYVEGYENVAQIPGHSIPGNNPSIDRGKLVFTIDKEMTEALASLGKKAQVTLNTVTQAVWGLLLQKNTNTNDVVFGSVVSGRNAEVDRIEEMVGLFINTIPVRVKTDADTRFTGLLQRMQQDSLHASKYDYYPLADIQSLSEVKRKLVNHIVIFQNYYAQDQVRSIEADVGLTIHDVEVYEQTNYDLDVMIVPRDELTVMLSYNKAVYTEQQVETVKQQFLNIVRSIVREPDIRTAQIGIVTEAEEHLLRYVFNDTEMDYPREKTLQQLFEEQAEAEPERVAVLFGDASLTYRELNDKANRLARVLHSEGVGAETRVGLLIERSLEMIVGILAILKAGGAYVPIDPSHPKERIAYMLEDAQIRVLATSGKLAGELIGMLAFTGRVLDITDAALYEGLEEPGNLDIERSSDQLAYILYTSGSTGNPKGVMVEHRQVNNFIHAIVRATELDRCDSILCLTTISFDIFGLETLVPLTHGMKVVLTSEEEGNDGAALAALLAKQQVQAMQTTPSRFKLLLEEPAFAQALSGLDTVLVGGEELPAALWQQLRSYEQLNVYNVYGPTETTIWSTAKHMRGEEVGLTIGGPIGNTHIFMMDRHGRLAPIGVPGELCIAGEGVARGYWGHEELTAEKFGKHPFVEGQRMYRTGDLARWLPSGEIEFLGRIDNQVKIRGHRIELGEIETRLARHDVVKEAVVIARAVKGQQELCAYVVCREGAAIDQSELKRYLKESLPAYMIPSWFVEMEGIPLTNNGKVNRKALPAPELSARAGSEYEAPRTETEKKLAKVWSEVLGVQRVGVHDSFLDLGGDSIKAIRIVSKLRKHGLRLDISALFQQESLQQISSAITLNASEIESGNDDRIRQTPLEDWTYGLSVEELRVVKEKYEGEQACFIQAIYPLTPMQEGMLFHALWDSKSGAYFDQKSFIAEGELDIGLFQISFDQLVERYDSLRTAIEHERVKTPKQIILAGRKASFRYEDLSALKETDRAGYLEDFEAEDRERGFDLCEDSLIRMSVFKLDRERYKVMVSSHHIVLDGWCRGIILQDFLMIYSALSNGHRLSLQEPASYASYIQWLERQSKEEAKEYWQAYVEGYETIAQLPLQADAGGDRFEKGKLVFTIDKEMTEALLSLGKKAQVTLNTVTQAVWGLLLQKNTNTDDVVFGSVVSGRNAEVDRIEEMVGLFINTIPVRVKTDADTRFTGLLQRMQQDALHASKYDYYPLADIQSLSEVKRKLVNHIVIFQNYYAQDEVRSIEANVGLTIHNVEVQEQTNYDLDVMIVPRDELTVMLSYNKAVYTEQQVETVKQQFLNIVRSVVRDPDIRTAQIGIVTEAEEHLLRHVFNDTEMDYPREKTLQQLFEEQAEAEPERVAVVFGDASLTYRELNDKANRLARVLHCEGVGAETRVGLLIERSPEMIVGVLAILKAGGAYVPIDPSHPRERIAYMLEDAQIRVLATSAKLTGELIGKLAFTGRVLDITDAALYEGPGESGNLDFQQSSDQLAYILYTSGSTGNPKGVMVEHRQVNNFIHAIVRATELDRCDSILCLTTISFDIFGLETLVPLTHGMKVVLTSEEEGNDGSLLAALLAKQQVQAMQTTPSRFKLLLEEPAFAQALSGLDTVLVGGEELPAALWQQLRSYEQLNVYNVYGPTETTIWSTAKHMRGEEVGLTIGGPIGNTHIFMMDRHGGLVPIGVPGELCIAGEGVARGYWDREELTAEKFGKHPFVEGQRMYRTGDLARWLPSGEIEFLGRIDNQVKIRGHRIELGEIETRLARHDTVKEAVVIAREVEGQQELCAYVVGREGVAIDQTELKRHLKESLPAYMIPSWFVELDNIPLTNNGKVNRKALPAPDPVSRAGGEYEAPRNETEETLARIWCQVLHAETVGVHDHFFDLGGHSLKATVMAGEIHKQLQVKIPLRELFQRPTIRELGEYIEQSLTGDVTGSGLIRNDFAGIERCEEQAWYEASSAQKRMYTVQQLDKQSTAYNMPGVYELEGQADPARIEAALQALVQRHEALRTSFAIQDGEIVQRVEAELTLKLALQADEGLSIKEAAARFVQPFDLEQAPLLRAELRRSEGKTYLLIDMHHIIADGVSVSTILMKEFVKLYNGEQLEEPRLQYKDFAAWHNKQLRSGELEKEEAYWLREFGDEVPTLTLRHDYEREAVPGFEGEKIRFALGEEATRGLRAVAKEQESTMTMVLLSVFTILLSKYSGQEDIVVGMPVAGRPHTDLQPVVGMFVNTLALRTRPQGGITYRAYLEAVKNTALRAYDHQNFQLEELIDKLNVRREPGRNPLFDVMFNMNNIIDDEVGHELDGFSLKSISLDDRLTKVDLSISGYETSLNIVLHLTYSTRLFKRQRMERAIEDFMLIVGVICRNSHVLLKEIDLLSDEEKNALLQEKEEVHRLLSTEFDF
ncbi:non-ribosomal peptide synthetase [Paenibacillus puerhi]|uniref:non-ribosomal peptide synthetase n=1 Tax=Paenibacillus puerhi TaxID=2692622 RepID=UPI001F20B694|nr:non-ribosomal peptide synthetase [Paenibacillus puerhi]